MVTLAREKPPASVPSPEPIRKALVRFFRDQRRVAVANLDWLVARVKDWGVWDQYEVGQAELTDQMTPLLEVVWEESGEEATEGTNRARARAGLDPDEWRVSDPALKEAIEAQARTLARNVTVATEEIIRATLLAGIDGGESPSKLRKRIESAFGVSRGRAERIARTETIRGYHAAADLSAQRSGVVAGWEWLASSDACPVCLQIAEQCKYQRLGQPFAVIGNNRDYGPVRYPPAHPHCGCTVVAVLAPEYGGPEEVPWGPTLHEPTGEPQGKPKPSKVAAEFLDFDDEPESPPPKPVPKPKPEPAPAAPAPPPPPKAPPPPSDFFFDDEVAAPIEIEVPETPSAAGAARVKEGRRSYYDFKDADPEKRRSWHSEFMRDWSDSLTEEEKNSVRTYLGSGYRGINAHYRRDFYRDEEMSDEEFEVFRPHFESAVAKQGLKEDLIVYRGVKAAWAEEAKVYSIKTIAEPAPMSTSINYEVAASFSGGFPPGPVFRIRVPKGSKAVGVGPIAMYSEQEILLAPGTKLKILEIRKGAAGEPDIIEAEIAK